MFRTGEPYTPISNFDASTTIAEFGEINSGMLPNYHRLDASFIYDFIIDTGRKKLKAQLGISTLNLYNRKIPLSYINRIHEDDDQLQLKQVIQRFSLGFTSNFSFRLFF